MVAVANTVSTDYKSAESPQTQPVESRELKHSKGAKKSAQGAFSKGVFSKLLADHRSIGKTNAGGEDAGELDAEGLVSAEKNAKSKAKLQDDGKKALSADTEKIQTRDRHLLSALKGKGETPSPGEPVKEGGTKKTKQAQKAGEDEEDALLADAEATLSMLSSKDPLLQGVNPGEGMEPADPDDPLFFAGASDRTALREVAQDNPAADIKAESARVAQGKERIPDEAAKKDKPRAAETRNSRKNKERFTLEVQDLRTGQNGAALNAGQEINPRQEGGTERVTDITVELKNGGRNQDLMQGGHEKSVGQAFEDILARELHQNLNGDIVRQASILVRDGGEGTIRLSLKPEALGMVKIRLEMAENKITGHIIVESDEALRAFEKEIRALEQAFRDSGFDGASLDMALAGDGGKDGGPNSGQGQWNREAATPFFSPQLVSSSYDSMAETMDALGLGPELDGFERPGVSRVNVLV
ncbi:hypothetical protein FACS189445_5150 [Spirochaetia bacterium]|nr:hypothetical protein FACS189445_5150 [Spirochaetia bacterium]